MSDGPSLVSPMPLVFVLLWSSGFIVARFGLPYAPPLTFLILRFLGVLAVLLPAVLVLRAPWPHGRAVHIAVAGLLLQAGYLAGVWCAIKLGLSIGAIFLLFALIRRSNATQVTSLMYLTPPTTALMAWLMFGEALSAAGMAGMALAVLGVAFVVKPVNK